ncbi:ATP-binding cassette domain-containing protein [Clostridium sp.]|uniref:ABC transporter ATP-binding protein/permease n=1 Tax=Clostridium sp. TaxID=1506 RepID=UPI003F3A7229
MELLQLKQINKSYKISSNQSFQVLKDINISFNRGELVSIIGESGSGKSTLMNLIGGLDSQFEGSLLLEGKNIGDFSEKELDNYRKNNIGFVFQSCNLIPHLSILDNVTIALTLSNINKEERILKATEALKQVGLEKHIHKKPNQLSGGQRQRVAIARALINDPDIILADEPTGALDSETTGQVLRIINDIAAKGKLVIMVTHSEKVAAHSSRIVQIADGEIIRDSSNEVLAEIAATVDHSEVKSPGANKSENLSFFSATKLAVYNMKQKLKRNILVSLGVSIGIMSLIIMLALGDGMKAYFSNMIENFMNPLVVEVNMPTNMDPNDPSSAMKAMMGEKVAFEEENIDELSKLEGVTELEKGFTYIAMPGTNSLKFEDKQSDLMGLLSTSSTLTDKNIAEGKLPGENEILINSLVVDKLGEDIVGKTVALNAVIDGRVVKGDFRVSGVYTAGENNGMVDTMELAYVNYDDIERILNKDNESLIPNVVYLVTDNEDIASNIKAQVSDLGYAGPTAEAMGDQMISMLNVLTVVTTGIAAISLVVSSIMILVVLYISVVERTKEIGLLRAIGARSKDIKRIFVSEAFLIGLSSGIIGLTGAFLISLIVNKGSMEIFDIEVMNITLTYALSGVAISTIVSMTAGLFPAKKASKLDPVDSLRTE